MSRALLPSAALCLLVLGLFVSLVEASQDTLTWAAPVLSLLPPYLSFLSSLFPFFFSRLYISLSLSIVSLV